MGVEAEVEAEDGGRRREEAEAGLGGGAPEDGGETIAAAVLDRAEHLWLAVVVIRVKKVAVGAVFLALLITHNLYVLPELVREARQVVRPLLKGSDLGV